MSAFLDSVLRGIGQVMLQNNRYAGLLFLLGIACNAPMLAVATLLGATVATATALISSIDRTQVRDGLWGFNGGLVAIAVLFLLKPGAADQAAVWTCAALAAAASVAVTALLSRMLGPWKIPALTAPFVMTTWGVLLLAPMHSVAPAASEAVASAGAVSISTLLQGTLNGVGQIFFQDSIVTGALFALGLFISTMRAGIAALAGSLAGALVAWSMGAAEPAIRSGNFGFNGALVAIALTCTFSAPGWRAATLALFAVVATPLVSAAVAAILQPFGLPALTLPYGLLTWLSLLLRPPLTGE